MSSDSSDEDAPVSISNEKAKKEHESEETGISDFLKRRQQLKKDLRRIKTEFLKTQKSAKRQKEEEQNIASVHKKQKSTEQSLPLNVVDSLEQESKPESDEDQNEQSVHDALVKSGQNVLGKGKLAHKKVYKNLNITVASLPKVEDKRAASAMNFKSKRLAKVHRENIESVKIHQEKLIASKK